MMWASIARSVGLKYGDWKFVTASFVILFLVRSWIKLTFYMPKSKPEKDVPTKGVSNGTNDTITVSVFKGSGTSISSSPFSTKMLSYLRLAGIPHIVEEGDFQKVRHREIQ